MLRSSVLLSALLVGAFVLSGVGCGDSDENPGEKAKEDPKVAAACVSTREYFTTEIYGKVMQPCLSCHAPGGTADIKGAKFKMYRETWPDFVSANLDEMKDYAKLEVDDIPVILLKATGGRNHGGGVVFDQSSPDYTTFQTFVTDITNGQEKTCDGDAQLGVELIDNRSTARKAAITLAGRFPTDAELAAVTADPALDEFIVKLTNEELFYDRLREIWNDALLTDRGVDPSIGSAYMNAPYLYDDNYPQFDPNLRTWDAASLTDEPLRYIEYVVRNNLPFSDVVTGNYVVANAFTARTYGLPHPAALVPESYLDWQRIEFSPVQNRTNDGTTRTSAMPVAGVLSTTAFLTRWETTPTNRGRKRARMVLKTFLATDILKFGTRPIDSTALTTVQNPTLNAPTCTVCHSVIDPIAGSFRGFSEANNLLSYNADDDWHDDLLPPGINGVDMPPESYGSALMWLGAQIPRDRRFGISVAQVMYHGLVGDDPLGFPQDKAAPDYIDRVRAYSIQNDWLVKIGDEFVANKFDLRKLVVAIVKSAYFRAKSGDGSKDALHAGLGQGRLLTPEMLGRKYRATTGLYYFANDSVVKDERRGHDNYLRDDMTADPDWRLVYGGIDSGDTTRRTETMSPVMLATAQYTGGIVACRATSYDFTKPKEQRRLFKQVDLTTTPFTRASPEAELAADFPAEAGIRNTIADLYFRLLGETVDPRSPEVDKVYGLFADTWKDLEAFDKANPGKGGTNLSNGRCVATIDYDKPAPFELKDGALRPAYAQLAARPDKADYQPGMVLDRDEHFTIRSWQAVMTFLLTDYRFTHE